MAQRSKSIKDTTLSLLAPTRTHFLSLKANRIINFCISFQIFTFLQTNWIDFPLFYINDSLLYTLFCILLSSVVFYLWVSSSVKWEEHCVKSRQMEAYESLTTGSDTVQLSHPVLTTHSYCSTQQQMATDTPMTSCWHCKLKHSGGRQAHTVALPLWMICSFLFVYNWSAAPLQTLR